MGTQPKAPLASEESNVDGVNFPFNLTVDLEIKSEDQAALKVPQPFVGVVASVSMFVMSSMLGVLVMAMHGAQK